VAFERERRQAGKAEAGRAARLGLGRIVTLHHSSANLYQFR
jgi:hypothetical protein